MHDRLRRRYGPEAVTEHQRVRRKQKNRHPYYWGQGDRRLVSTREHQTLSGDSRTRTALAEENSSSTSFRAPPLPEVRTTSTKPSPQSTRINSVAPWKACVSTFPSTRTVPDAAEVPAANRIFSGRSENRAGPSGSCAAHVSGPHRTVPPSTSPFSRFVCPINCAAYAVAGRP